MRRSLIGCLVIAMVGGCLPVGGSPDDSYTLTAVFDEAVGLYEQSRVKVMGFDVGLVDAIDVDDDEVSVRMSIDADVPLPDDVEAGIVAFTVIGERNVELFPPWQPGDGRLDDGATIGRDRTRVPVEVDEALETFVELSEVLDADAIRRLLSTSATAIEGRGGEFAQTLDALDALVATADSLDTEVIALAEDVTALAATLNRREEDVVRLIEAVGQAGEIVRTHRDDAQGMLQALVRLNDEGAATLEGYTQALPARLEELARLGLVLRANTDQAQALVSGLEGTGEALQAAFDEDQDAIRIRLNTPTIVIELLSTLLAELLTDEADG